MRLEPAAPATGLNAASRAYLEQGKARATVRAYRLDWQDFLGWCGDQRLQPLPASPSTVCAHLSALADAGARVSTIQRRVASISQAHQAAGHSRRRPRRGRCGPCCGESGASLG